jgi:hypothetical protein
VETTGLSPSEHRIIEVAYARVLPGQWGQFDVKVYRFSLTPEAYRQGTPKAYEVNGYYPGHPDWKDAPGHRVPRRPKPFGRRSSGT